MIENYHGSKSMEAVILAGGFGKRMGQLTQENQKCLLPIDEKPTLIHIIERLITAYGSIDVKIGVAYQAEKVIAAVNKHGFQNATITYVPHIPGSESAGAYATMQEHTNGGAFLCMPGDVIAHASLYDSLTNFYDKHHYPVTMAGASDVNEVTTHGLIRIAENKIIGITPPPPNREAKQGELRDMGIFITDTRVYDLAKQYPAENKMLSSSFHKAIRHMPIGGIAYTSPWIHLADRTDLQKSARERNI